MPIKYFLRTLALLRRYGLATTRGRNGAEQVVLVGKLPKTGKSRSTHQNRRPLSHKQQREVYRRDLGLCSISGKPIRRLSNANVDHIIPLALGGADELGNLTIVRKQLNKAKSDNFDPKQHKFYRGKRIIGTVRSRFFGGSRWPVINGKIRREKWPV